MPISYFRVPEFNRILFLRSLNNLVDYAGHFVLGLRVMNEKVSTRTLSAIMACFMTVQHYLHRLYVCAIFLLYLKCPTSPLPPPSNRRWELFTTSPTLPPSSVSSVHLPTLLIQSSIQFLFRPTTALPRPPVPTLNLTSCRSHIASITFSMDPRDWFFEAAQAEAPLTTTDDMFILPANISHSSLWNHPPFSDVPLSLDALQPFPPVTDPATHSPPNTKTEDNVSDVTDVQLPTSPSTKCTDRTATSPNNFHTSSVHRESVSVIDNYIKPRRPINKRSNNPGFMPALSLREGRAVIRNTSAATNHSLRAEKTTSQKRPADDSSRQRHNEMMRQNRGRFNKKFKELTDLLESLKTPAVEDKPMKNKIQILERAMYQYALMESQRAVFKNELLFSPPVHSIPSHFVDIMATAPTLHDACQIVVRNMCASHHWKYGEVWTRSYSNTTNQSHSNLFALSSAFVSPKNMPSTRQALYHFAKKGKLNNIDSLFVRLARFKHAIWISDVSTKQHVSKRAQEAVAAGVTTMLIVPITVNQLSSGRPDAIIVLMHADDDLLSFSERLRTFDSDSVCRLNALSSAVVESRSNCPWQRQILASYRTTNFKEKVVD